MQALVTQFKARILGYIEYRTPAVYHANATTLTQIDKLFEKFLRGIGLTKIEALRDYNLAPLNSRRDIAMLGAIHRAVLGQGPEQLRKYFILVEGRHPTGRNSLRRHGKQIATFRSGTFLETTTHSILGLVDIYNLLPPAMVDTDNVHTFQAKLQALMKAQTATNGEWELMFSPRRPLHSHPLRRLMNGVNSTNLGPENEVVAPVYDGLVTNQLIEDKPPAWW